MRKAGQVPGKQIEEEHAAEQASVPFLGHQLTQYVRASRASHSELPVWGAFCTGGFKLCDSRDSVGKGLFC